jgi:beta-galactosidase
MSPKFYAPVQIVVWAILVSQTASALEVRVRPRNNVPLIHVDGQPVRGRMFFGIPGRSEIKLNKGENQISFHFEAIQTEPNHATMHLRFGDKPGTVLLDDIRVVEEGTGREVIPKCGFDDGMASFNRDWTHWPLGKDNTVGQIDVVPGPDGGNKGVLQLRLSKPAGGKWLDFHIYHQPKLSLVKGRTYQVTLRIWSDIERSLRIELYRPGSVFVRLGMAPGVFEEQVALARDAGVDFVSLPVPMPWPRPGHETDYSATDAVCRNVLRVNPNALLLPRVGMEPPKWWKDQYPGHVMVWEDGPQTRGIAVASAQYRKDAAAALAAFVHHLEEEFGENVAGYHPCGHNTGEWFYQRTWEQKYSGYAPATKAAWRDWLRSRYSSETELRAAWNNDTASFDTAEPPTPKERHANPGGIFRLPATERHIVDFNRFQQEAMADCVLALARSVREASERRKLSVFFYGYVFEFTAAMTGPAISGHYGLRRVLESPDIDILCSPISYNDRGLGQSAPVMTAAESVTLAGKLWLNEDDTATYLSSGSFPGHSERVDTFEGSNNQLLRNVGQEACRNFATWWMDLGGTGWFNDRRFWDTMKSLEALDAPLTSQPQAYHPSIAAVVDEDSMMWVAETGFRATRPLLYEGRAVFARSGVPFGQYLLDDVVSGQVDTADVFVFLNPWHLDAATRQKLLQHTRNKLRIWCYAPGLLGSDNENLESMRQLTGFAFRRLPDDTAPVATPTAAGKRLGLDGELSVKNPVAPLFAVADTTPGEVLATYPDGSPAIAIRHDSDGTGASVFVGIPNLSPALLRGLAKQVGVPPYTEDECVLYANGPLVVVHATRNGKIRLNRPQSVGEAPLRDVLTGHVLGDGPTVELDLRLGDTRILQW